MTLLEQLRDPLEPTKTPLGEYRSIRDLCNEAADEIERLHRMLKWCRPRLRRAKYRVAVDRYMSNRDEPDYETKLVHAELSE